ncbi:MAG TPA: alcohol dehydrogenase catalytic domain-containing protein [Gemmatimonadales bacterium]|nr:alcohol dehydrogenase catalytic domain-containing protein [Gemmatimonadales bacterium]
MKAVVFHGVGDIRLDDVTDPTIEAPTDAIVRITASAICGTDLHMIRGTLPGMEPGTVLGHEGVGVVEEVGADVRNLRPGDRVVIASTTACGYCAYCREGVLRPAGNCNHRRYIPNLLELVQGGVFDPSTVLTQQEALATAVDAYEAFDSRADGWIKVELRPAA